jgi:hypothetical protein
LVERLQPPGPCWRSHLEKSDATMAYVHDQDPHRTRTAVVDTRAVQDRFIVRFYDPAFEAEREAIARLEAIAWDAVQEGRKAPLMRPAGRGFADPSYEVSVQRLDTRKRLKAAQKL